MKNILVILFFVSAIAVASTIDPTYKVVGHKSETEKVDSVYVEKAQLDAAIEEMSKRDGVTCVKIERVEPVQNI